MIRRSTCPLLKRSPPMLAPSIVPAQAGVQAAPAAQSRWQALDARLRGHDGGLEARARS